MPTPALDLFTEPFRAVMSELGWQEGRTVLYRILYADGDNARLPELARALAASSAGVLVAAGTLSIRILQEATANTPIVGRGFRRGRVRPKHGAAGRQRDRRKHPGN